MFLPTTLKEVRARGWDQLDVILFTGDAYIDHPSFGAAVVGRLLEAEGYRVAIVPQPNWRDDLRDFTKLGTPRLFFGVTAGAMDSMVNHYTANIRLRSNDAYTPGGKAGFRPDYAVKTYTQILKRLFPRTPVVIGGIEASLRRLTHYDYWSDSLHPSILADSGADLLIYGMGERAVVQIADALNEKVEQGMINISMNTTPIFQNGSSAGNLMIVNESVNNYPQVVEIHRNDTGEVIYKSGAIPVGSKLETAKLSADLDAGTYGVGESQNCCASKSSIVSFHRSGVTVFHFVTMPQGGQYILQAERRKEKNL